MILKFKSQLNMAVVNNYGTVPLINAVALKVKGVALHTCACPVRVFNKF